MISVLIPIYNFDATPLVFELSDQLSQSEYDYEIICLDNASTDIYSTINSKINQLPNCHYDLLAKDIGRSKIRNLLAKRATYATLLFLDCDVLPATSDFIKKYLMESNFSKSVLCGGLSYSEQRPEKSKLLRWVYGRKREVVSAAIRAQEPYRYFFASNFLIKKDVFESVRFNEKITKYGYEDLIFSQDLKANNYKIKHLDNQVIHLGIDSSKVYLEKVEQALHNLVELHRLKIIRSREVKLLEICDQLKKIRLDGWVKNLFNLFRPLLIKNLTSNHPLMALFDFYRIGYLCLLFNRPISNH
ncbi:MAG: glycosyltransferase [Flavobacteriaceae bacterium]|nr:glycosyltransferase [Flavobacteriaceae bacterium]